MTKTNKSDAGSIIDTFQTGPENLYYRIGFDGPHFGFQSLVMYLIVCIPRESQKNLIIALTILNFLFRYFILKQRTLFRLRSCYFSSLQSQIWFLCEHVQLRSVSCSSFTMLIDIFWQYFKSCSLLVVAWRMISEAFLSNLLFSHHPVDWSLKLSAYFKLTSLHLLGQPSPVQRGVHRFFAAPESVFVRYFGRRANLAS